MNETDVHVFTKNFCLSQRFSREDESPVLLVLRALVLKGAVSPRGYLGSQA